MIRNSQNKILNLLTSKFNQKSLKENFLCVPATL